MKLEIHNLLSVEGASLEDITKLIALAMETRKELGGFTAPSTPMVRLPGKGPQVDYCEQWKAIHGIGVRMTKDEILTYGEDRQAAAKARLEEDGVIQGNPSGAMEGATMDSAKLDPDLVNEF